MLLRVFPAGQALMQAMGSRDCIPKPAGRALLSIARTTREMDS